MNNLDSLNIRKGLELGISVSDIFKIDTSSTGNVLARDIFQIGVEKFFLRNPEIDKTFLLTGGLSYTTKKKEFIISDTLRAYVFDTYMVNIEPLDDESSEIIADYFVDIEFLNTKILTIEEFCMNVMAAQKFCGQYNNSIFKYSFAGAGEFSLEHFLEIQRLFSFSTLHAIDFYIKHKNIVSGIGSFAMGLYRNDIMKQREYFTTVEFLALLDDAEAQFNHIASLLI